MKMKKSLAVLGLGLFVIANFCGHSFAQMEPKTGDVVIGSNYAFSSKFLNSAVPISIHVPPDYEKDEGRYPVLYLLDSKNDFRFAATVSDFLQESSHIPGMIVVAIAVEKLSGPPKFMIDFLEKELFPEIEKTYRTLPCRLLYGHSGRSFAALFILLNRPDLFYAYICPGLALTAPPYAGAADFVALASVRLSNIDSLSKSLFFSLGDEHQFLNGINKFVDVLKTKAPKDFEWKFAHMENDDHFSTKLKTLYEGLEFAFRGYYLPREVAEKGADSVKEHYERLGRRFGFSIDLAEPGVGQMIEDAIVRMAGYQDRLRLGLSLNKELISKLGFRGISKVSFGLIGYFAMNEKRYDEAVELYNAMAAAYPGSGRAHHGLGMAHEKSGRLDLALADFEEACKLGRASGDPQLPAFQSDLDRVRDLQKK